MGIQKQHEDAYPDNLTFYKQNHTVSKQCTFDMGKINRRQIPSAWFYTDRV